MPGWAMPDPGAAPLNPNRGPILPGGNYGIDLAGIDQARPRYWINDVEVQREAALAAIGDGRDG